MLNLVREASEKCSRHSRKNLFRLSQSNPFRNVNCICWKENRLWLSWIWWSCFETRITRALWEWLTYLKTHRRSWSSWSAWKEATSISGSRIIWELLKMCLGSYSSRYARLCSWYTLGASCIETLSLRIFWCTSPTLGRKITAPFRWSWLILAYRRSWLKTNGS